MNNRGFQLSINMLVVIIIGLVLLGVGTSLFYNAYGHVSKAKDDVDKGMVSIMNSLMDDGSIIVVPFNSRDAKRGKSVEFALGINNELGENKKFNVLVTYAGTSAYSDPSEVDPFEPVGSLAFYYEKVFLSQQSWCDGNPIDVENCGQSWILMLSEFSNGFELANNARKPIPIIMNIPKNAKSGQYIFNIDICVSDVSGDAECEFKASGLKNRYGSRQKLYINI